MGLHGSFSFFFFIYSCNLKFLIIIIIIIITNQPGQRLGILCSFKPFTDNGGNSHLLTIKEEIVITPGDRVGSNYIA